MEQYRFHLRTLPEGKEGVGQKWMELMKELQERLGKVNDHVRREQEEAIKLLKDYIREYGEIDWTDNPARIETTFYGNGYFTAEVIRVLLDDEDGTLIIETSEGWSCEFDGEYTNDTILDILCCVIGNDKIK